jgi:hypothetical protein
MSCTTSIMMRPSWLRLLPKHWLLPQKLDARVIQTLYLHLAEVPAKELGADEVLHHQHHVAG